MEVIIASVEVVGASRETLWKLVEASSWVSMKITSFSFHGS